MIDREKLLQSWGPMLLEAVILVTKGEINLIRAELGLSPRTNQQLMDAIKTKLDSLPELEWLKEIP